MTEEHEDGIVVWPEYGIFAFDYVDNLWNALAARFFEGSLRYGSALAFITLLTSVLVVVVVVVVVVVAA